MVSPISTIFIFAAVALEIALIRHIVNNWRTQTSATAPNAAVQDLTSAPGSAVRKRFEAVLDPVKAPPALRPTEQPEIIFPPETVVEDATALLTLSKKEIIALRRQIVALSSEIVKHEAMEAKRRESRIEDVGSLAGGIAHDFNNLLTGIFGNAELARMESTEPEVRKHLQAATEICKRASALTRQLLAFSRQQKTVEASVQLWRGVEDALVVLRASLPSTIHFETSISRRGPLVWADPAQIRQVVINLATNAVQAMAGQSGKLSVTLETVDVDADLAAMHPELKSIKYQRLIVTDNGQGIEKAVLNKIFDPFFTTKLPGEGTGLGLAVVQEIVKSYDGAITVDSQLGEGTRFDLYFPIPSNQPAEAAAEHSSLKFGHGEGILVIDDEAAVATMSKTMLEQLGYHVDVYATPETAFAALSGNAKKYQLVIADLTMLAMSVLELTERLRKIRPDLPIIFATDGGQEFSPEQIRLMGIHEMISKASTVELLAESIHRAVAK